MAGDLETVQDELTRRHRAAVMFIAYVFALLVLLVLLAFARLFDIDGSGSMAGALRIAQVGDMNKGTVLGSLETDFQLGDNVVNTQNLRIQQLDGLGDATANQGWFKIESALTLNYVATVVLSPDATSEVKKSSPIIGFVATILENNNRVSVPVNITGDARNPQVQVDVSRIF